MEGLDGVPPEEGKPRLDPDAEFLAEERARIARFKEYEWARTSEEDKRLIERLRASGALDQPEIPGFKDPERPTREEMIARFEWIDANPGKPGTFPIPDDDDD